MFALSLLLRIQNFVERTPTIESLQFPRPTRIKWIRYQLHMCAKLTQWDTIQMTLSQRHKSNAVFYSPPHVPMDSSWTLHNLLKSHDNPFKVLWSPRGVPVESSWSPHGVLMESMESAWSPHGVLMESSWSPWSPHGVLMESSWSPWSPHGVLIICDSGLYTYQ